MRLAFASLALLMPLRVASQVSVPVPDALAWERVALPANVYQRYDVRGVGFCGNTLYANMGFFNALRGGGPGYPASSGTWEPLSRIGGDNVGCVRVAGRDILYMDGIRTTYRSLDGGYTVERVLVNGRTIPAPTPGGALIGWFDSPGYIVCRTEDGDTWGCNPYVPGDSGFPRAFAAARPGGPIPEARLIANGQGGPAYSDDDGRTWHPSNLMISVQTFGWGLAVIDGGPLHGTAVAVAQPGSNGYRVFQTTDGATWTDVGPAPDTQVPGWDGVDLVAIPGGLVAAYGNGAEAWLSGDGGRTWRSVFDSDGPGADDSQEQVTDLDVGPDGRLYLGVLSSRTQDAAERGGVYRTTGPLFAVAGEAPPAGAQGLGVSVRPNPSGRRTEIVLTLAEAQPVRVSVFDALGREVAVMLDGAVGVGERVVGVDTSAWPAGVYVVRASVGGRTVSARLVVAR